MDEFKEHYDQLAVRFPGWRIGHGTMCKEPLGSILRGFAYVPWGGGREFHSLCIFAMPLFVPYDGFGIDFTFSHRVRGTRGADLEDLRQRPVAEVVAEMSQAIPTVEHLLSRIEDPRKFVENLDQLFGDSDLVRRSEAEACTWAYLGDADRARGSLAGLEKHVAECESRAVNSKWARSIMVRVRRLLEGKERLEDWERETRASLGLA